MCLHYIFAWILNTFGKTILFSAGAEQGAVDKIFVSLTLVLQGPARCCMAVAANKFEPWHPGVLCAPVMGLLILPLNTASALCYFPLYTFSSSCLLGVLSHNPGVMWRQKLWIPSRWRHSCIAPSSWTGVSHIFRSGSSWTTGTGHVRGERLAVRREAQQISNEVMKFSDAVVRAWL